MGSLEALNDENGPLAEWGRFKSKVAPISRPFAAPGLALVARRIRKEQHRRREYNFWERLGFKLKGP
jgi:hypothetical protein